MFEDNYRYLHIRQSSSDNCKLVDPVLEMFVCLFVFVFVFVFFCFFSTFYFNLMKLCYIALLITPIMTGINNLCPIIIVKYIRLPSSPKLTFCIIFQR